MKYNKLPKRMIIRNPLGTSARIEAKISRLGIILKTILITTIVAIFAIGGYFANLQYEEKLIMQKQVSMELDKGLNGEPGVVLDTTAGIIQREGKLPLDVAKKYAIWIYEAGVKYKVDPLLILSVMSVESKFDYRAISSTGPIGLLQVAASWHKEKTTQAALFDPKNNIDVGTQIIKEYQSRSSTDIETLLRYNGSLGQAPVYAVKVLGKKSKYETEILEAVVKAM